MSKQNNLLNNKAPGGDVVELSNDWQQVGGALGNLLGQLTVTPTKATDARAESARRARPQSVRHTIGDHDARVDKAA